MADATGDEREEAQPVRHPGGCVVLSPAGSADLGVLLPALTRRWASLSVVSDEPAVMEALAAGGVSVVVVVEPGRWRWLASLASAVGRHYGRVLCMRFEAEPGDAEPRIRSLASRWMQAGREPCGAEGAAATGPTADAPAMVAASLARVPEPSREETALDAMLAATIEQGADRSAVAAELDADEAMMARPGRKVAKLAVRPPAVTSNKPQYGPPEALVTEEELTMLLGPGPVEAV